MYKKIETKKSWSPNATTKTVRMVRCSGCGRLIESEKAYCLVKGPKKTYYCCREEYEGGDEYRAKRDKFEDGTIKALKRIICYDQTNESEYSFNDGLYNTLLIEWTKSASFEKIYYYLNFEEDALRNLLISKKIQYVSTRLKLVSKVLLTNIVDYDIRRPGAQPIDTSKIYKDIDLELYRPDLKPRKSIRRSMEDLEDKYGN